MFPLNIADLAILSYVFGGSPWTFLELDSRPRGCGASVVGRQGQSGGTQQLQPLQLHLGELGEPTSIKQNSKIRDHLAMKTGILPCYQQKLGFRRENWGSCSATMGIYNHQIWILNWHVTYIYIYVYINGIWPSKTGNEIVSCKHQQRSDFQSAACKHHTCGVSRQK